MNRPVNTMGFLPYITGHIFWGWLCGLFFLDRFFVPVFSLEEEQSKLLMGTLILLFTSAGLFITRRRHRNLLSLTINVLSPYGLYLTFAMVPDAPPFLYLLCALFLLALGFCTWTHISTPLSRKLPRGTVIRHRLASWLGQTRILSGMLLCSLFFLVTTGIMLGTYHLPQDEDFPTEPDVTISFVLNDYRSELSALVEDNWKALGPEERLQTLQTLTDIECAYLGLPDHLSLETAVLDDRTLGDYVHSTRSIRIDRDHLETGDAERCMRTIFHEVYHSYQYQLCEAYLSMDELYQNLLPVRNASSYIYEFNHYVSGRDDFDSYAQQQVESDARTYASDRMKVYRPLLYELGGRTVG